MVQQSTPSRCRSSYYRPLHSTPLHSLNTAALLNRPISIALFFLSVFSFSGLVNVNCLFLAARRRRYHHGGRSAPLLERYSAMNIESSHAACHREPLGNCANSSCSCTIEPYNRAYDWRTADRLVLRCCSHMHLAAGQPLACRQPTLFPWKSPAIDTLCERHSALVVRRMPAWFIAPYSRATACHASSSLIDRTMNDLWPLYLRQQTNGASSSSTCSSGAST